MANKKQNKTVQIFFEIKKKNLKVFLLTRLNVLIKIKLLNSFISMLKSFGADSY